MSIEIRVIEGAYASRDTWLMGGKEGVGEGRKERALSYPTLESFAFDVR